MLLSKEVAAALHSCATSSCCILTGCAHLQTQARAAQNEAAAAQQLARQSRDEAVSLQSSQQESLVRAEAQQHKIARLEAEVVSLQRQLQADQVIITLTAHTNHVYGQICRQFRCYVSGAARYWFQLVKKT